jgi:hypothetical protein
MKNATVLAWMILSLLILHPERTIAEVRNNPNALRGIDELDVMVHRMDRRLENSGYSQDQIRAQIESKLRMAIIKVHPKALPTLVLDIKTHESPEHAGLAVITLRLDLYQFVDLPLSQQVLWVSTWSVESIIFSEVANISGLREILEDLLTKFIHDYKSVNPKK